MPQDDDTQSEQDEQPYMLDLTEEENTDEGTRQFANAIVGCNFHGIFFYDPSRTDIHEIIGDEVEDDFAYLWASPDDEMGLWLSARMVGRPIFNQVWYAFLDRHGWLGEQSYLLDLTDEEKADKGTRDLSHVLEDAEYGGVECGSDGYTAHVWYVPFPDDEIEALDDDDDSPIFTRIEIGVHLLDDETSPVVSDSPYSSNSFQGDTVTISGPLSAVARAWLKRQQWPTGSPGEMKGLE